MSPLILAVDTTHEFGSLALARGREILEEVALHAPTGFAHVLYEHLAKLLDRHGVSAGGLDLYAAAAGPGSFTGVRVGLACVKGLAAALGKPAVAVSNLQALATYGGASLRAAVMDARRGEVYGAVYEAAAQIVTPEVVTNPAAWLATLPEGDIEFVAQDAALLEAAVRGTRWEGTRIVTAPRSIAGAVARLALEAAPCDPASLDANYVRRSDAELFWKE